MELNGIALITGAGSGIGRACSIMFSLEGVRGLCLVDINESAALQTLEECKKVATNSDFKAIVLKVDVTSVDSVKDMVARSVEEFGQLHYAVNCAGVVTIHEKTAEMAQDVWDKTMNINLNGVMNCQRFQLQQMLKQEPRPNPRPGNRPPERGSIVNIGSCASLMVAPHMAAYAASKHAVLGLTKAAAMDYAQDLIRVNCVCPTAIATPLVADLPAGTVSKNINPFQRMGLPEEVAEAVVWLASPRSSLTTGTALLTDGGQMLG